VANAAPEPAEGCLLDAQGTRDAQRHMDERGEAVFAAYSSRPYAPAEPAAMDGAAPDLPGALYLVISLNTEGVLELRGFCRQGGGEYRELALLLAEDG
jgi:proteasome lid subunit RPN8/RPN11